MTDFLELQEQGIISIGCDGVTFLPYLGGKRTPNWPHATGALLGLTHQTISKNTQHYDLLILWILYGSYYILFSRYIYNTFPSQKNK